MLSTNELDRLPYIRTIEGIQIFNWRSVDLNINVPYFFLEYSHTEANIELRQRRIISSCFDLIKICEEIRDREDLEMIQVAMFAPPWINENGRWELVNLTEIIHAEFGPNEPRVTFYVTTSGETLSDSINLIDLQDAKKIETAVLC